MNILITNDDGYSKTGIQVLIQAMKGFGDVYVMAPQTDQSGTSHSLTLHEPLKYDIVEENQIVVSGTPADCVHFARHHYWKNVQFDLCVSGINHGANIGDDVWYSGTIGGAIEAALHKIPSIAISLLCDHEKTYHFDGAVRFLKAWFENHIPKLWDPQLVLNMNIPPKINQYEYRWTSLGPKRYLSHIDVREDLRGNQYFWIGGTLDALGTDKGTDSFTLSENVVSITPLSLDLTHWPTVESENK